MALKINLLPPYIYEGSSRKKVLGLWVVIIAAVAVGLIYWKTTLDAEAARIAQMTQDATPAKNEAQATQSRATAIENESAAVRGKYTFVSSALDHIDKTYPVVVDAVRKHTIGQVLYSSLEPAGQVVTLDGYAPNLRVVGEYMMHMSKNPAISRMEIDLPGLPSFPSQDSGQTAGVGFGGQQQASANRPPGGGGYDFRVRLALLQPVQSGPAFPAGGGGQQGPAAGGGMTMPGMGMMPGGPGGPAGGGMMMPGMGGPMGNNAMSGATMAAGAGGRKE